MKGLIWLLFFAAVLALAGCKTTTVIHVDALVTPVFAVKRATLDYSFERNP